MLNLICECGWVHDPGGQWALLMHPPELLTTREEIRESIENQKMYDSMLESSKQARRDADTERQRRFDELLSRGTTHEALEARRIKRMKMTGKCNLRSL